MDNYKIAPVILFVYNRPLHTKRTLQALNYNIIADRTKIIIFSDAAKTPQDEEKVIEVRQIIRQQYHFKEVEIKERTYNMGLAQSIIEGVSTTVEKYGKCIVLEDDIITSRYFLQYMNDALCIYENEDKVMAVSGSCWLSDTEKRLLPETFLLPWFNCWGWATWKRAWKIYEKDCDKLCNNTTSETIRRINVNGSENFWDQVLQNKKKIINTWAIFFFVNIVKNNGLVLYSRKDLCRNIGLDGSGVNCIVGDEKENKKNISDRKIKVIKNNIITNKKGEKLLELHFRRIHFVRDLHIVKNKIKKTLMLNDTK